MRVTLVNYAYDEALTGPEALLGTYHTLTGWAEALASAGVEVSVAQRFGRDARLVCRGVDYTFRSDGGTGAPRSRLWPRRLHRAVVESSPDVVHINGLNVPIQSWLLRRTLPSSTAIVIQDHGGIARPRGGAARRAAMRAGDGFFFTASSQAAPWREAGLIAPHQPAIAILEASTTMGAVERSAARRETGLEGDPAVLWVGRLNANKDPLTILAGFENVIARLPRAVLTMLYGAADLQNQVERRVRESPALAGRVRLVGAVPRSRMPSFYSAADLFVLGSHYEGSGYALIEACACGLPPVVSDIPTYRVITDGGSIGALWPVGDAGAFTTALLSQAGRDTSSCRREVRAHFDRALSWPAVARQAKDAYAVILAAVRARRQC